MTTRKETNRLLEMVENGLLDPMDALRMAVCYMSEDEVADILRVNGLSESDEDVESYDDSMDGDEASALASIGWGTDEDYGYYGEDYGYYGED